MAPYRKPAAPLPAPGARAARRRFAAAGGLVALAGALLLVAGCDEPRHVVEARDASVVALAPQRALRIETRYADIVLAASPDDSLRILTARRVQSVSDRSARNLMSQIRVTIERAGDTFVLRVREPERSGRVRVQAGPWRIRRSVEIQLTIAVPAGVPVSYETERGDLEVENVALSLDGVSTSGDFDFSGMRGPIALRTASGDVVIHEHEGAVQIRATSGDVSASGVAGPFTVRATSGDVQASRVRGRVAVETSSGDVEALDVDGSVRVGTSSGDVTVVARPESLVVETSTGGIDADAASAPSFVSLKSSSGDVTLHLPARSGGALDVQTATGSINARSAIDVEVMNRNRLTGRLGGSGQVQIRTSSGDIQLAVHSNP